MISYRCIVVKSHTGGETVESLFDDSTCLVVVATTDTELCAVATTREVHVVVVCETAGADGFDPVGAKSCGDSFIPFLIH